MGAGLLEHMSRQGEGAEAEAAQACALAWLELLPPLLEAEAESPNPGILPAFFVQVWPGPDVHASDARCAGHLDRSMK